LKLMISRWSSPDIPDIKSKFHENKDWNIWLVGTGNSVQGHQEQVPRKQGLKPLADGSFETPFDHQEQVPRKQGLKHDDIHTILYCIKPSRASSTKTRIETFDAIVNANFAVSIKSKFHENKDWNSTNSCRRASAVAHQEQVPRKQGLKLKRDKLPIHHHAHQEQVPRKQGLKQRQESSAVQEVAAIKSKFHENKDWNAV